MNVWVPGVVDEPDVPAETATPFTGLLVAEGANVVVEVPAEVTVYFGRTGHVPVMGLLDGIGIAATLVPTGRRRHKLYLNGEMREAAALGVGDEAELQLWFDPTDRRAAIPGDLEQELVASGLLEAFVGWPPSHQREYIVTIEAAKTSATRISRIQKTVEQVRKRADEGN